MQISTLPTPAMTRAGHALAGAPAVVASPSRPAADTRALRQAAAGLQIDIVTSADALSDVGPEWDALFECAGRADHVFQTHGFAALWTRTYLAHHGHGAFHRHDACPCRLAVVTARRNGRLVLVWPMIQQTQMGLKVLTWLGEPVAQYGDVVADPSEPLLPMLRRTWDRARAVLAPDVVRLRKVRCDATIAPFLAEALTSTSEPVEAPCITLAAGGSAFEDRQSGKAKKNRRRLMRRLEEQGPVEFRAHSEPEAANIAVTVGLAIKRDWLLRRGLMSPALSDAKLDKLLAAAVTTDAAPTGARVFSLELDSRTVAVAVGFVCRRRLMLHLITQTQDVERFGAGVLHLEAILRHAEAEGLEAVDMLPPKADYKLDWSDRAVGVADHVLGNTPTGKLWARTFDGFARPHLKRVAEALPLALRRRMAARALRLKSDASP